MEEYADYYKTNKVELNYDLSRTQDKDRESSFA